MGLDNRRIESAIRASFSRLSEAAEVLEGARRIVDAVRRLRLEKKAGKGGPGPRGRASKMIESARGKTD
jgi:hypothetical protein